MLDNVLSYFGRKESSHSKKYLDDALFCAIGNLNYDAVELLINSGADVNSLNKDNKNSINYAIKEIVLFKKRTLNPLKNLLAEINSHPIYQLLLNKGSELSSPDQISIFELSISDSISIEGEPIYAEVSDVLKNEPIYAEVSDVLKNEPIYAEPSYALKSESICHEVSNEYNNEPTYGKIRNSLDKTQNKSSKGEPIYATVNYAAKRKARKIKEQNSTQEYEIINNSLSSQNSEAYSVSDELIYEEINNFNDSFADISFVDSAYGSIKNYKTQIDDKVEYKLNNHHYSNGEVRNSLDKTQNKASKSEPIYATVNYAEKTKARKILNKPMVIGASLKNGEYVEFVQHSDKVGRHNSLEDTGYVSEEEFNHKQNCTIFEKVKFTTRSTSCADELAKEQIKESVKSGSVKDRINKFEKMIKMNKEERSKMSGKIQEAKITALFLNNREVAFS